MSLMRYVPDFLAADQSVQLLQALNDKDNSIWQQEQFSLFGKSVNVPRQLAWFGDDGVNYRYTGLDHHAGGWPDCLLGVKRCVSELANQDFNFVLLNRYQHGQEYMGWHRDDEKAAKAVIASVSLGAQRRFKYKHDESGEVHNIDLADGSLLLFDGRVRHMLAKTQRPVDMRVNLTFRSIVL